MCQPGAIAVTCKVRAARSDRAKSARIVTLRDRDLATARDILETAMSTIACRRGSRAHFQRTGDLLHDALRRGLGVEHHLPAQEIVGIEPPSTRFASVIVARLPRRDSISARDRAALCGRP